METLFKDNKYTRWYNSVITHRVTNPCMEKITEKHHIIPKSFGGSNHKDNLVVLSIREHIFCHKLLPKMVILPSHKSKMLYALYRVYHGNDNQRKLSSKFTASLVYAIKENHRKECSDRMTNRIVSDSTRKKLSNSHLGKQLSQEHKNNLSKAKMGISSPKPAGFGETISRALVGKHKSPEHVAKINNNPDKIQKTADKHRGMKRSKSSKETMSISRKQWIAGNGGQHNKGYKSFYDPEDPTQIKQCLPTEAPLGWKLGNPNKRNKQPFQHSITLKIKWFSKNNLPNLEEWKAWNPNKR